MVDAAIKLKPDTFEIHKHGIYFIGTGKLDYGIHTSPAFNYEEIWRGKFIPEQWQKMKEFIKEFTEQPLCIEVKWYGHTIVHDIPEITFSDLVKSF